MQIGTQILMLKGFISELTKEQQQEIDKVKKKLAKVITKHPEAGLIALSLLGLELAEQASEQ